MPAKKFRFVSPGVQIKEIDKSQLPKLPGAIGPVVVGRTLRGPGMVPVTVSSYEEFVEKFGSPDRGAGSTDVWRNGNTTSPTYAAYAAEAYLKNSSPLTMVRLLGTQHPDAGEQGAAGWTTDKAAASSVQSDNGGAYGLFIMPSASAYTDVTGALAAVIYLDEGSVALVGKTPGGTSAVTESSALIQNIGSSYEFRVEVKNGAGVTVKDATFNFDKNSSKYIRKVFNTNPTLTNEDVTPTDSQKTLWLGETYETFLRETVSENSGNIAGSVFGMLAPLQSGSVNMADFKGVEAQPGKSGWIISQDLNANTSSYDPADMTKLFRFVASEGLGGDWEQNNVKVSIFDIKPSQSTFEKFGTFSVGIRKVEDVDASPEFVEVFTNCSLNPNSADYVAAKIGDRHLIWDSAQKRHKELGDYPNISKYVRVEMNQVVEQGGLDPELLPFGFFGHPRPKTVTLLSGSSGGLDGFMKVGNSTDPKASLSVVNVGDITPLTASIVFPRMKMRVSASDAGALSDAQAFFGVVPNFGSGLPLVKLDEDYRDLTRAKPDGIDSYVADGVSTENSVVFTLDNVIVSGAAGSGSWSFWEDGSRKAGRSYTSILSGNYDWGNGVAAESDHDYKTILAFGHDKFTLPLFGGFDGLDITEREPFRNSKDTSGTPVNSYIVNSLHRAVDSVKDPEVLDMNLLVLPGITRSSATKYAIDVCEQRADALAIIDIEGGYEPSSEGSGTESTRLGGVSGTITALKARNLNSSYGCTYYPWVKVVDSESGQPLWMPPSVVALGTMASSQESSAVWFAPAGFNRGGLSLGSSGLSVVGVREKLTSKQRDSLYELNVNPIASFPSEGIVIFGQKTLQATPSALDRINVRRLVLFIKKEISRIAANLLFEQNVSDTWNRFKGQATPVLESVKSGLGISEYKLVLDESTTTPEEIDRNMMYAKLFIKPVYAIEFIGVDFVITNTGASFEDL
jgi:hypothetical protein